MATTKDRIFAVADELDATGHNPTLAAVRKTLGGGSFTTISEAMSEWRSRKAAKEQPLREPTPAALTERLQDFGGKLWAMALELANARLDAEREALDVARRQLESEKCQAAELADQLAAELDDAKAHLERQAIVEQSARDEVDTLRTQLVVASERAATGEARAVELSKRADDLSAELGRIHEQNAELLRTLSDRVNKSPARAGAAR